MWKLRHREQKWVTQTVPGKSPKRQKHLMKVLKDA